MRALTLLLLGLLLLACASQPASVTKVTPETLRAYPAPLQECVIQLTEFKRTGQQQGVQDAQLLWDPRYPHLAFDRFSLSLLAELHSSQDKNHWLDYVARQAAIQRQVEYQKSGS